MNTKNLLQVDRELVRKSLGKTNEDVFKDIKIIKDWLLTQKHLPEQPTDNMIEFFLTNCKYSIEKTKHNLDMYYSIKTVMPEMYQNVNPCLPNMQAAYDTGCYVILPKLTPELYRICFLRYKAVESNKADMRSLYSYVMNGLYEIRIHEDLATSDVFIIDCQDIKFGILLKITPMLLKQTVFISENVHSNRVKGIHFYKAPGYFHDIISLLKSVLSNKISERVYTHQTIEELCKHVPLELLPSDYGGKEKSMEELDELWKQKVFEYKDRFDKLDTMRVNEELRPERLINDEILGYYGNFKKIDTD